MNIFLMVLVALFMAGFYMLSSPSQHIASHSTEYAVTRSDLRSIAQCATAMHNAQINGTEFDDICITQNDIHSEFICLDQKLKITKCEVVKNKKPAFSYIVTTTGVLDSENHNDMMDVLETHYRDAGTFGIFMDGQIMSGGTATKRIVPDAIISQMELSNGRLVYLTQYEIPDAGTVFDVPVAPDIICPVGSAKTFRFGRWQCIGFNPQSDCGGDMIWDSDLYQCVPDESRKPLCADSQTAVIVDSVWECISPFPEKSCPEQMIARLNYNTLEWECVMDPNKIETTKKCAHLVGDAVYGHMGSTLRIPTTSCTDCERMVIDYETCRAHCVPDLSKLNDARCYPGAVSECDGPTRAFYFGFPDRAYITNVSDVSNISVPFGGGYSQNRRFNCMDCGADGAIDTELSHPPYVAICK